MDAFYTQLKRALETAEGDIWTETVLEGERRGEKRLLTSEPDEEKGSSQVYCERISHMPRLIICGGAACFGCPSFGWGRCWALP